MTNNAISDVHENGIQIRFYIYVHATPLTDFTLLINWPGIITEFLFLKKVIDPDKVILLAKKCKYFLTHQFKHVFLGAQKNRLK